MLTQSPHRPLGSLGPRAAGMARRRARPAPTGLGALGSRESISTLPRTLQMTYGPKAYGQS